MNTNSNPTPKYTEEEYALLLRNFPVITIDENTSLNKIMISTGEQRVLAFVKANIGFTARRNLRDC